jgi:serine/threonine protein kinase
VLVSLRVKPGDVLQGKYRLASLIGEGGMGSVWRAEHLQLEAPVAVKLMHPSVAANPAGRGRFDREAKSAASLRSPHVVQILDFGVDAGTGTSFIAMELLEGESLRKRLTRTGKLAPLEVSRVVIHVARALTRAHELELIHRDLKPANIFLVENDGALFAKVLDFGIAKWLGHSLHHSLATTTNSVLGTPHYMSPEQISSSKSVDFRADLWSLGVIAVECLTGRLPFDCNNLPGLAFMIQQGNATRPSALGAVPNGFDAWFARATAAQPDQRHRSAAEMALELRRLCEQSASAAPAAAAATPLGSTTLRLPRSSSTRG